MVRPSTILCAALLALGLLGCKNELTAELTVDGESFVPTSCQSGEHQNFMGVSLIDDSGDTLRLVQSPSNEPQAIWMSTETVDFGTCGRLHVAKQSSEINNITNVEGTATLDCTAGEHTIKGTVAFKNCH